jgi:hypothetical protein
MALDIIILIRANPLQRLLEGVSPENRDLLGPWKMATSEASAIWAQKSRYFQGLPLPMALVNVPMKGGGGGTKRFYFIFTLLFTLNTPLYEPILK